MNIYVGHSSNYNFKEKLYKPIRESVLNNLHNIVLPHEKSTKPFNSNEYLKECDLMIAEVSKPSTGLGMELGWAHSWEVPILAIHEKGTKSGGSLTVVIISFIEYEDEKDMISKLETYISALQRQ